MRKLWRMFRKIFRQGKAISTHPPQDRELNLRMRDEARLHLKQLHSRQAADTGAEKDTLVSEPEAVM